MDRLSLALPTDQDALIQAVAVANPNTVVVLQTGGAVTMPWLAQVPGVLQLWLPGDGFGTAAAKLLFGDAEPAGRLPVTFPLDETQGPARARQQYPGSLSATGAIDDAHFDEGLQVGYRYWDAQGQAPLFPFGHGLSYTTFSTVLTGVRETADGGAVVDVSVRNNGGRAGVEVVQVYVGFPASAGEPPRQLKGFEKLLLPAGEERKIQIKLGARAFEFWDERADRWSRDAGAYRISVGRSSRDLLDARELQLGARRD
jgi:beta-glucosidase